jgi:hypothetical protein
VTDQERLDRLAFAGQLLLCVHRVLGGHAHNPCGALYSVDNPEGFDTPVKLCGCNYPAWEIRRVRRA